MADAGERGVEAGDRGKAEGALAEGAGGEDFGGEEGLGGAGFRAAVKEQEGFAGANLGGGADEGPPEVFGGVSGGGFGLGFNLGFNLFCEQDFDEAGGLGRAGLGARSGAGGEETRGQDAGVVENEEIAGLEELRKIGEEVVAEGAGCAIEGRASGWSRAGRAGAGRSILPAGRSGSRRRALEFEFILATHSSR